MQFFHCQYTVIFRSYAIRPLFKLLPLFITNYTCWTYALSTSQLVTLTQTYVTACKPSTQGYTLYFCASINAAYLAPASLQPTFSSRRMIGWVTVKINWEGLGRKRHGLISDNVRKCIWGGWGEARSMSVRIVVIRPRFETGTLWEAFSLELFFSRLIIAVIALYNTSAGSRWVT
jgi:hypothetical protein